MKTEKIVRKLLHCGTYPKGSEEYTILDLLSDYDFSVVALELEKYGYTLTYNLIEDEYCVS